MRNQNRIRLYIAIVLTIFSLSDSYAFSSDEQSRPYTKIKAYGLFSSIVNPIGDDSEIYATSIVKPKLEKQTTHIPCISGTWFGVLFDIYGLPQRSSNRRLSVFWTHPEIQTAKGEISKSTSFAVPVRQSQNDSEELLLGWGLEEIYELVPGDWTILVYHQMDVILRKTFTVEGCERINERPGT